MKERNLFLLLSYLFAFLAAAALKCERAYSYFLLFLPIFLQDIKRELWFFPHVYECTYCKIPGGKNLAISSWLSNRSLNPTSLAAPMWNISRQNLSQKFFFLLFNSKVLMKWMDEGLCCSSRFSNYKTKLIIIISTTLFCFLLYFSQQCFDKLLYQKM